MNDTSSVLLILIIGIVLLYKDIMESHISLVSLLLLLYFLLFLKEIKN